MIIKQSKYHYGYLVGPDSEGLVQSEELLNTQFVKVLVSGIKNLE